MTQISRPQPEHQNNGYLDSGPYSADQWAELYETLFTGDEASDQGPLAYVLNELEVTNPSGSDIQVNTGWGICNGHLLKNNAAVTFTPGNPSANPRIDVVVMVQNNTAIVRTAGITSGNDLVFPNSLTDYNGLSSLPPYTCRLAILKGTEAGSPTAPTLDVDTATLFMVPLAQYQISTGGTVSALTDRREYAQKVNTKRIEDLAVTTAKLGDNSVDDTKVGDRVPQFYRRQGGDATDWSVPGTTSYTPTAVRMQSGTITTTGSGINFAITFPVAFSAPPVVFIQIDKTGGTVYFARVNGVSATQIFLNLYDNGLTNTSGNVIYWLAIGPE